MSLKSSLVRGPVKNFMTKNFKNVKPFIKDIETSEIANWKHEPSFPYNKINYFLLGTAYDYYIRVKFAQKKQDDNFTFGLFSFINFLDNEPNLLIQENIKSAEIDELRWDIIYVVETKGIINLQSIIKLSYYEDLVRSLNRREGPYSFPNEQDIYSIEVELEKFISNSSNVLLKNISVKHLEHGKTFGIYSEKIGGADLDLITNDLIIDMKTNKELSFESRDWHQVIGYVLLNKLFDKESNIDKIAIYYARYDKLFYINLNDIGLYNFTDEFEEVLKNL